MKTQELGQDALCVEEPSKQCSHIIRHFEALHTPCQQVPNEEIPEMWAKSDPDIGKSEPQSSALFAVILSKTTPAT